MRGLISLGFLTSYSFLEFGHRLIELICFAWRVTESSSSNGYISVTDVTTYQTACKAEKAVFGQTRIKLCIEFLPGLDSCSFPERIYSFNWKYCKWVVKEWFILSVREDHRGKTLSAKKKWTPYDTYCSFCFQLQIL